MNIGDSSETTLRIQLHHNLKNAGSAPIEKRVGLWSIIQLPGDMGGVTLIPLEEGRFTTGTPAARPYFTELAPSCLDFEDSILYLKAFCGLRYKIGVRADSAMGRIAFLRRSRFPGKTKTQWILVAIRFEVDPIGTYLDKPLSEQGREAGNGDAVQAYNDPGLGDAAFCEIEAHAPAVFLQPEESQHHEIEIVVAAAGKNEMLKIVQRELTTGVAVHRLFAC
jgi:hypothetical protein